MNLVIYTPFLSNLGIFLVLYISCSKPDCHFPLKRCVMHKPIHKAYHKANGTPVPILHAIHGYLYLYPTIHPYHILQTSTNPVAWFPLHDQNAQALLRHHATQTWATKMLGVDHPQSTIDISGLVRNVIQKIQKIWENYIHLAAFLLNNVLPQCFAGQLDNLPFWGYTVYSIKHTQMLT